MPAAILYSGSKGSSSNVAVTATSRDTDHNDLDVYDALTKLVLDAMATCRLGHNDEEFAPTTVTKDSKAHALVTATEDRSFYMIQIPPDSSFNPLWARLRVSTPESLTGTSTTFTNNSSSVTGVNTHFSTEVTAGQYVKLDADGQAYWAKVQSITNDTTMVLVANYAGTGGTGPGSVATLANSNTMSQWTLDGRMTMGPLNENDVISYYGDTNMATATIIEVSRIS